MTLSGSFIYNGKPSITDCNTVKVKYIVDQLIWFDYALVQQVKITDFFFSYDGMICKQKPY